MYYFPNGQVNVYYEYDGEPTSIFVRLNLSFDDLENTPLDDAIGFSKDTVKDLKLLQ